MSLLRPWASLALAFPSPQLCPLTPHRGRGFHPGLWGRKQAKRRSCPPVACRGSRHLVSGHGVQRSWGDVGVGRNRRRAMSSIHGPVGTGDYILNVMESSRDPGLPRLGLAVCPGHTTQPPAAWALLEEPSQHSPGEPRMSIPPTHSVSPRFQAHLPWREMRSRWPEWTLEWSALSVLSRSC